MALNFLTKNVAGNSCSALNLNPLSECKKSPTAKAKVECESDTTTITWPTDRLLPGSTQQVPESIRSSIIDRPENKHILKVIVFDMIPP